MKQVSLFDMGHWWDDLWRSMPEFDNELNKPEWELLVHLRSEEDFRRFEQLAGHVYKDKCMFYPAKPVKQATEWYGGWFTGYLPQYPVYVISKGRWETRHTAKDLERCQVPYHIVVEPQEAEMYRAVIQPEKVLVLPFANLGKGSIPARNWVWEHAAATGAARHWILDDNIYGSYRLNKNKKLRAPTGSCFRAAEDFVDRYENVAIAGLQYRGFCDQNKIRNPVTLNTRIYSCILIRNDLRLGVEGVGQWGGVGNAGGRWGGGGLRYNEDTDLSLRALKGGWATVLFNAMLADKIATLTTKGGNTDELYAGVNAAEAAWTEHSGSCRTCDEEARTFCDEGKIVLSADGRWRMAEALREQHPDVTTIMRKWGRWQHSVDYSQLRDNPLKLKPGIVIPEGVNDYGMVLSPMPGREAADDDPEEDEFPEPSEPQSVLVSGREVEAHKTISVYFKDRDRVGEFGRLLGQPRVVYGVRECWWPKAVLR